LSIRYVATVLDHVTDLTATQALVLVALADYTSDDTRECWPSIPTIARRARCSERSAQRHLRALELRGLIDIATGGHQYGRNTASRYRLKFDHLGEVVPDVEVIHNKGDSVTPPRCHPRYTRVTPAADKGDTGVTPSVIRSVIEPKSGKKPPNENQEALARAAAVLTDEELDARAREGRLTATEEYEREHRRRMRPRKSA